MASYSLRLRRALTVSSSLLHQHVHSPKFISPLHLISSPPSLTSQSPKTTPFFSDFESFRHFRSSPISFSSRNLRFDPNEQTEISPDTILFEGCDYNHWLITVDFPADINISGEEKVQKYVEIAAGVFGSEEEAKKKIYACSTTVYTGFQVECSEETSEKFKENPAVVFVLPDSYIDPVNKEYGGDKYINGTIIPRPPPIAYTKRNTRGTRHQENRGSMQREARNFGPQQNHPNQQNFGPQQNHPNQQNFGPQHNRPTQPSFGPPHAPISQQNYGPPQNTPPQRSYAQQQNAPPQHNYGPPQNTPPQQTYAQQQNAPPQHNYGMPGNATAQQNFGYCPPQHNYGQSQNHTIPQNHGPSQTFTPQQNFGPAEVHSPTQQNYGQPGGPNYSPSQGGTFYQGLGGAPGQGSGPACGQDDHPMHGEGQKFSEADQRSRFQGGEKKNFA